MTIPSGRTVLITGGVSGLGLAMATAFAACGARFMSAVICQIARRPDPDRLRGAGASLSF